MEKDRTYLRWNNRRAIKWIISGGHHWFKSRYLAAVSRVEEAGLKNDRVLLSDCYYEIGDVHDFNRCPRAAIKAYKKSFDFDATHSESLREMGDMYETMGHYKKAVSILKKSLEINPEDECAVIDYETALYSLKHGGCSLYEKGDECWQGREYLAEDKPGFTLKLLRNKRSILARQILACAYAALNDSDGVLDQWQRIFKGKCLIEVRHIDWFYLEDCVDDNAEFWEILAACAKLKRFDYSIWPSFKSVCEIVVPHPAHRRVFKKNKADIARCNKQILLMTQYNIARVRRDRDLAQKLFDRYPNWPEMGALLGKLKR